MIAPPLLGFALCGYLWLSLGWRAKVWGFTWLILGALWGIYLKRRSGGISLGDMS
jgi:hypothetical protein